MRKTKKYQIISIAIMLISIIAIALIILSGCSDYTTPPAGAKVDIRNTLAAADVLQSNQPTPTDIEYSLERYNLIRRAYWVNGQREKARNILCPIADVPLGYVILFTDNGGVIGRFIVEGKVTSLNSFLTPDSEYYEYTSNSSGYTNKWLADIDGSYGTNDNGIFFFTPDGRYVEWTGIYLYSDIPFEISDPIIYYKAESEVSQNG